MTRWIRLMVFLPASVLLAACGSDEKSNPIDEVSPQSPDSAVTQIACTSSSCSAGQYCLEAFDSDHKVIEHRCVPTPEGCEGDIECLKDDARTVYKETKHCQGAWITVTHMSPGAYKVSCTKY